MKMFEKRRSILPMLAQTIKAIKKASNEAKEKIEKRANQQLGKKANEKVGKEARKKTREEIYEKTRNKDIWETARTKQENKRQRMKRKKTRNEASIYTHKYTSIHQIV